MDNDQIEVARTYHEATKHSYVSVRRGTSHLDWDNRPLPYKIYPEAGSVALPRELKLRDTPALTALALELEARGGSPDTEALARVLFCAAGLTQSRRIGAEEYHFRAAASAGALYPIEIYPALADVQGLDCGLYHFSPADLKLRGLRIGDWREVLARAAPGAPAIASASATLVLSTIFWRSAWKYRARAYRYCFWDAGTILANLLAATAAEELSADVVTAFADAEIEQLLGADGEREGPICLVALGHTQRAVVPAPEMGPLSYESIPLSSDEVRYDELVTIHRKSRLESPEEAARLAARPIQPQAQSPGAELIKFPALGSEAAAGLGKTILRRGSTRVFARDAIGARELAAILAASSRHPRVDFPPLAQIYLIVNAVEGMNSGAYYYDRSANGFELLKTGQFRAEAGYLCLEQQLGHDCSALLVYMADLERVLGALGNRGYRDAHLEAGILGGRAYLAAYALGRGASGLTFYDDDTTRFFEPHAAGKSPLLMVALGVPRSRAGAR